MIRVLRITVRVRNQDEALQFYTERLGFEKRADFPMGPGRRWLTVGSKDDPVLELVLQLSDWCEGEECQRHAELVGKDPTIVFQVDDCWATYEKCRGWGLNFPHPQRIGHKASKPTGRICRGIRWCSCSWQFDRYLTKTGFHPIN